MSKKKHEYVKKWNILENPKRCGIQYYVNRQPKYIKNHSHNFLEIEYVEDGAMEHVLNGDSYEVTAGDCYFLGTRDCHEKNVKKPMVIHNICIIFKELPPVLQRLLGSLSMARTGRVSDGMRPMVEGWFGMLGRYLSSDEPYADERATAYAMLIISELLECSEPTEGRLPIGGQRHIANAMSYISTHYGERLLLSDVARAVYLSPNHFSKLFCEANGIPFTEYITRYRIEHSKRLLTGTEKSVTDIALECGFSSFSTFSRSFKKLAGCTPTEYRSAHSATILQNGIV